MAKDKPPKFTKDGLPDNRGHADGSRNTQFGPNDGRPRPGRPKKSQDLKTIVQRVRALPVETVAKNRKRTVSTQEGILLAQRSRALNGCTRAAIYVQTQFDRFEPPVVDLNLTASYLEEDQAILAAARARGILLSVSEGTDDDLS